MSEKSEQRESGFVSETPRGEKQERKKHSSDGVERRKVFFLDNVALRKPFFRASQ